MLPISDCDGGGVTRHFSLFVINFLTTILSSGSVVVVGRVVLLACLGPETFRGVPIWGSCFVEGRAPGKLIRDFPLGIKVSAPHSPL